MSRVMVMMMVMSTTTSSATAHHSSGRQIVSMRRCHADVVVATGLGRHAVAVVTFRRRVFLLVATARHRCVARGDDGGGGVASMICVCDASAWFGAATSCAHRRPIVRQQNHRSRSRD